MDTTDEGAAAKPPARRKRSGSGRVRLEEVARLAGVSTASVSRAFNEPDKVTDIVREKVLEAARALNWIPDAAGRALASSRTHIAGAIIPTLDNEIFARQISGMQSVYAQHGFTLLLGCSNYDPEEGLKQAQAMIARGVEALTIVGEDHPVELFDALRARQIPYVVTYSYRENCPHPCIGFDNKAAFTTITRHLISLGHEKFGAIFQPEANNDRARARLEGIREALSQAGLSLSPKLLHVGVPSMEFAAQSFSALMANKERPSAIICGNDNLALGALTMASDLGFKAPDDFSITGFDDLAISSRLSPRLTTMKVDNQQIGIIAAQHLLKVLRGSAKSVAAVELKPTFLVRDSSGPYQAIKA